MNATGNLKSVFFFNDTATTEIYTLSLHDALPIWPPARRILRAAVEALDEGEEVAQLGGLAAGIDEHLVGRARLRHAQGQGGVEVPRLEEEQRVHGCSAAQTVSSTFFIFKMASMWARGARRSEEHTSELQSRLHLVCRLLLE